MIGFLKTFVIAAICLLCLPFGVIGGIRSPGKYAGTVMFDRWDTCYLYSGIYLMYISDQKKELLRRYTGKSILIDAKEVFQPINPGDGLITEFTFLGLAETKKNLPETEGLHLSIRQNFDSELLAEFELEIENRSRKTIAILPSEVAPTVLGKIRGAADSPSDGGSEAVITRCSLSRLREVTNLKVYFEDDTDGHRSERSFGIKLKDNAPLPYSLPLRAGRKLHFTIALAVPHGNYECMFGYGGGVHEGKGLVSNSIPFTVDDTGKATLESEKGDEPGAAEAIRSDFMNLLFGNYRFDPSTIFGDIGVR